MKRLLLVLSSVLIISSCTRQQQSDNGQVFSTIAERIETHVEWYQGCPDDQINCAIQCLLENEITPEAVIQIALLKNPKVQSIFEELGIAHADLVEAGLLSNPDFSLDVRYPYKKNLLANIEYLVTATFLDFFFDPSSHKVSSSRI